MWFAKVDIGDRTYIPKDSIEPIVLDDCQFLAYVIIKSSLMIV